MKSLTQSINESMIMELSSELLSRASKKASELGRNSQARKFAVAAGKALEKELKGWKPGPNAKNCGKVVNAIKKLSTSNSDMKNLAKIDPPKKINGRTRMVSVPVLKPGKDKGTYKFVNWNKVEIPDGKFYIFRDEYHGKHHIGTISDIFSAIAANPWDFEDFNAGYITGIYDSLKDAVEAARELGTKKFYDSESFMNDVESGKIKDADVMWEGPGQSIIELILDYAYVENLPFGWRDTGRESKVPRWEDQF